jgi:hypothetical protein
MRNALQFDLLHNGQTVSAAALYQLRVSVSSLQFTAYLDPVSGRPDSQIENFTAYYQLVELATGKTVVNDLTYGHVSYDIPGSQQRFAGQRARRDAEDRAIQVAADAIRNASRHISSPGRSFRYMKRRPRLPTCLKPQRTRAFQAAIRCHFSRGGG